MARFVELELKYEGYDVTTCHDGRVGMEMITNQEFDMVLLDLMLPGLTGIEICRRGTEIFAGTNHYADGKG